DNVGKRLLSMGITDIVRLDSHKSSLPMTTFFEAKIIKAHGMIGEGKKTPEQLEKERGQRGRLATNARVVLATFIGSGRLLEKCQYFNVNREKKEKWLKGEIPAIYPLSEDELAKLPEKERNFGR